MIPTLQIGGLGRYGGLRDPFFANVVFLANFDTGIIDVAKGKPITVTGNPTLNFDIPFAGSTSVKFDGVTASSLTLVDSTDWTFSGPYTVDGWVWIDPSIADTVGIIDFGGIAANNFQSSNFYYTNADDALHWVVSSTIAGANIVPGTALGIVTRGAWFHYELSWDGTTYRRFLNGVLTQSVTSSTAAYDPGYGVLFGAYPNTSWNANLYALLKGALGPQRITKGVCRHTANFTPHYGLFPTG